jgi:hypothetical protein
MTLYEIIKALQSTAGSKAKKAILEANKDNTLLKEYLQAVYDPSINYYMTKIPSSKSGAGYCELTRALIDTIIKQVAERKITGKYAKDFILELVDSLSAEGQELLGYIIARDIRASIAEKTLLSVWPDLFFIPPYQRCATMKPDIKAKFAVLPYFFVQKKADGSFAYVIKLADGSPMAMTRAGSVYPTWVAKNSL